LTSYPGLLKGTTTIGVVCRDGVVLSTDTRATMGYFVAHKKAKKLYKIDKHLAMTIAGAVADAQRVVDILSAYANMYRLTYGRPMPVSAAARLVANILFENRRSSLLVSTIIAGVDDEGPRIFQIDPFGSLTEEKCVSTGSGSPIAYGVLEDGYREGASVKEMLPVVVEAISSAMKRDVASGDDFDVAVITREGFRELTREEKDALLKRGRE